MTRAALFALALALALLLSLIAENAPATTARPTQAQMDTLTEREHSLPAGLLRRHRRYERARGRCYPRYWNKGRGAVCGPHQVLIWDRTTRDGKRLGRVANSRLGAAAVIGLLLKDSRARFNKECGKERSLRCVCPWQFINNGDRVRLCAKLTGGGDS